MNLERAIENAVRGHEKKYKGKNGRLYGGSTKVLTGICRNCKEIMYTNEWRAQLLCSVKCQCEFRRKSGNYNWNGGRTISSHGYVMVTSHYEHGIKTKRLSEHRVVMEKHLGRKLMKFENVHHKNGIRTDNRIENLELWTKPQAPGQRVDDLLDWCVKNYREEIERKLEVEDAIKTKNKFDFQEGNKCAEIQTGKQE